VALMLILVPLEVEKPPPLVVTATTGEQEQPSIGESISDVTDIEISVATPETTDVHSAIGGSFGDTEPDLSGLSSRPSGLGAGTGTGVGDGSGADIAGR